MDSSILRFEGVGWSESEASRITDLGNTRIRTAFEGGDGKVYYLECLVSYVGFKPELRNMLLHTWDFLDVTEVYGLSYEPIRLYKKGLTIKADKSSLLQFINENTNSKFSNIEVVNDNSYSVFIMDTDSRKVFRLGNTGDIYTSIVVLSEYEQFIVDAKQENAIVVEVAHVGSKYIVRQLAFKGYRVTGISEEHGGNTVFNHRYVWADVAYSGDKMAVRLNRLYKKSNVVRVRRIRRNKEVKQ